MIQKETRKRIRNQSTRKWNYESQYLQFSISIFMKETDPQTRNDHTASPNSNAPRRFAKREHIPKKYTVIIHRKN